MGRLQDPEGGEVETSGKVVVGIDGSEHSWRALRWALTEAKLRQVACVVLHACDVEAQGEDTFVPADRVRACMTDARATLAEALEHSPAELRDGMLIEEHVAMSAPADALIAASKDAALLVVGTRGWSELKDLLLGSVSTACVHHGRCPTVVIPHQGRDEDVGPDAG